MTVDCRGLGWLSVDILDYLRLPRKAYDAVEKTCEAEISSGKGQNFRISMDWMTFGNISHLLMGSQGFFWVENFGPLPVPADYTYGEGCVVSEESLSFPACLNPFPVSCIEEARLRTAYCTSSAGVRH